MEIEVTEAVAPNVDAHQKLSDLVDSLKLKYPQHRLSFGYIGNVERWGDDRSFMIFTRYLNTHGSSESYHLGGWKSLKFNEALEMRVNTWVASLDMKYQKGTLVTHS